MSKNAFNFKSIFSLLKETGKNYTTRQDPFQLSASVAFYAIFSLPALLIIIITIAGSVFGKKAIENRIANEISDMIGQDAGQQVQTMISIAQESGTGTVATIIGIATILFGATAVFIYLQKALNKIWDVRANPNKSTIIKLLFDRLTSFGLILVVGFLLLISLVITSALTALQEYILSFMPESLVYIFYAIHFLITFSIVTLLFALIFKILPDAQVQWRSVWVGSAVTTILFFIGKYGLGLYFGEADPGSTYGVAGSIILMLLWVNYSCLILFFGAELTQAYARRYGQNIEPSDFAIRRAYYKKKKR